MSLRKPILKVTRKCPDCKGLGNKTIREKYFNGDSFLRYEIAPGEYCYVIIDCKRCSGLGRIDIKQNDPKFKKYYQEALEEQVDFLTTEYRYATSKAFEMGEELRKHCKELDKVVNK